MFSEKEHNFHSIVRKTKFFVSLIFGVYKLHLPNIHNFDAVRSPKWPAKKSFYIAVSLRVRLSETAHVWIQIAHYVLLTEVIASALLLSVLDNGCYSFLMLMVLIQWCRIYYRRKEPLHRLFYSEYFGSTALVQSGNAKSAFPSTVFIREDEYC